MPLSRSLASATCITYSCACGGELPPCRSLALHTGHGPGGDGRVVRTLPDIHPETRTLLRG
jgi:hypothetical protein